MINDTLNNLIGGRIPHPTDKFESEFNTRAFNEALTAIYEIGLECIGADEEPGRTMGPGMPSFQRDQLRASQRKAWAKACGVAEK